MLKKTKASVLALGMLFAGSAVADSHGDMKMLVNLDMNYTHWSNGGGIDGSGDPINEIPNHMHNNNANELNVQLAEFGVTGSHKSIDYWISFDAAQFSNGNANSEFITEAYLTHTINDQFAVTAGRFYGNLGFESIRAKDNWNYSRSYGFQYNPIWHQGVAASFNAGNGFSATAFAYNNIDNISDDQEHKSYSVQLAYARDNYAATYNYYTRGGGQQYLGFGDDGLDIHDLSVRYDINNQFAVAANYIMSRAAVDGGDDAKWNSLAAYVHYQASERFDLTLRYEMFDSKNMAGSADIFGTGDRSTLPGLVGGTGLYDKNKINSITLTAGYDLMNNSKLMFEARMDKSDEEIWTGSDHNHGGTVDGTDKQNTFALAWVFSI